MLGLDEKIWKELNGFNTANEIFQQPALWKETGSRIEARKDEIESFLKEKMIRDGLKIIFTGAGTSAYVGEIAAAHLNKRDNVDFQGIATTDIVSNPEIYFKKDTPTILVSFARSGNSPESLAVYNLANKLIDNISHVFITCNGEGELAKIAEKDEEILLLLMPKESNDKGFAMTGSFSCMTLATLLVFDMENLNLNLKELESLISQANLILNEKHIQIDDILKENFNRIVYLGSGSFYGLAKESSLKILELTRGQIVTLSESVLGFRHGPKSILNDESLVVVFISNDEYSKLYEMDMLKEIFNDSGNHRVMAISSSYEKEIHDNSDMYFYFDSKDIKNTGYLAILFGLFSQILALKASIKTNIEPDNPNPTGLVNRVVKGVTIYDYDKN